MLGRKFFGCHETPGALNGILAQFPRRFCAVNIRPTVLSPFVGNWKNGTFADDRENILVFG